MEGEKQVVEWIQKRWPDSTGIVYTCSKSKLESLHRALIVGHFNPACCLTILLTYSFTESWL